MSSQPRRFLGATRSQGEIDQPVTQIELDHGVNVGVRLRTFFGEGMVPIFEEQSARLEAGIRVEEWSRMDRMEKALIVAHRRIRIAMQNLQAEAEIKKAESESKKHGRK